ncbi:MAG: efflux RND transporter periplasmic adaptor subunit [Thauera phenolivorans]|uniref:Efflux RND transporter periplasmic adaptor subunit n=1 Tax=Thauera phenolivorans TaxID=1792543 RepID=A0A7X7LVM3_9RHOO|nr:efflux RND transporter periplasmic adaptor subunit [Thauera phenolivorans]
MASPATPSGSPDRRSRLLRVGIVLIAALALLAVLPALPLFAERVVVANVDEGELLQSVVVSGKVRSPRRVELGSQISGQVVQVLAREGDALVRGQALIQLDDEELQAALAQAAASLAQSEARLAQVGELALPLARESVRQAEATLVQAQKQFERTRELVARGFYSQTQLDEARRSLDVARSQLQAARLQVGSGEPGGSDERLARLAVDQARASLALARARLAYARIEAPVDGVLLMRGVEPGDAVQPGKLLMTISPLGMTELVAQIDEKNLELLALGQAARVSADAFPARRFDAELSFISPVIDALRGSVEVRLRVPEPPDYLREDMTVSIDIVTARRERAIVVPADTVRDAGGEQPWVLVVRDGVARRQPVRAGLHGDGRVEILEGVVAGEQLVPAHEDTIGEGDRVRPLAG